MIRPGENYDSVRGTRREKKKRTSPTDQRFKVAESAKWTGGRTKLKTGATDSQKLSGRRRGSWSGGRIREVEPLQTHAFWGEGDFGENGAIPR